MARQAVKGTDRLRAQWYWKSSYDPWSRSGKEEWTKYSDIESEIIEEAFNGKDEEEVLLPPGTIFQIIKVKSDPETGKTYIDLKLQSTYHT
ncbi:unnamed protein product [Didymodactylos carnosus]|uniref:NAD(P)(+)--arginine ADP-ribosyltransferase n=1 Tax=Didymodactylos carnosus TaxID=1234261 RepID=A0A815E988_9BILA|nr:unnamed protein product [Didymodactylos carnosus]CAF1303785.1 unnamed protein product [Didymodactylos carnosus]CAF4005322.1 unnamed protein product [Didymodactylos carnosus]CAF4133007.1 unnamed protein product [Didymodactylos carnosus]